MEWVCKKCGKTLEMSDEQLHETQGVVICPQCLGSERVPGYRHKATAKAPGSSTSTNKSNVSHQSTPAPVKTTPPPYRKKINFVEETPQRPAAHRSTAPASTAKPKKKKSKKKKNRSPLAPHSTAGCLWRSVLYTLILMAATTFVGFILDFI